MWLPKDERYLIEGYWRLLRDITTKKGYEDDRLFPLLSSPKKFNLVNAYGEKEVFKEKEAKDVEEQKKNTKIFLDNKCRIKIANTLLHARGLIDLSYHLNVDNVLFVKLTEKGYDLGRRYASKWSKSGLWFASYKDHWIWIIVSFLGGLIGSLIVNLITK